MRHPTTHAAADLLRSFTEAAPDRLDAEYQRLVEALWHDGHLTDLAVSAAPTLVASLDQVSENRQGYLVILLGLLAEAEYPTTGGEVSTVVRRSLGRYLDLLRGAVDAPPRMLALLYLVSHFPEDRERVLAAVEDLPLGPDDRSRLDRNLRRLDPDNVVLGRVWPSPSEWTLSQAEREYDQGWIRKLSPAHLAATWRSDTRMLLGYSGAKAYWALRNGPPMVVTDPGRYRDTVRTSPGDPDPGTFGRYADAFHCPHCHGRLDLRRRGARCASCGAAYSTGYGVLDLSASVTDAAEGDSDDVLQNAAVMRNVGFYYETVLRPAFLRLMGSNWGGAVTPSDEDDYLVEHARPADGPLLDLAAGAGRWTAVLAETLGAERVIALDLNMSMLTWLRGRLPGVPTVRASALTLPFDDATLGGVNCWNALQALPDQAAAIAEIGRCLRPGGTFTMMTFRWASDPVYRYFQRSFSGPGFPTGMPLFELDEIRTWLTDAGMTVRAEWLPGTFVFITAERAG